MVANGAKISQKIKKQKLVEYRKKYYRLRKMSYYKYKKLLIKKIMF